MPAEDARFEDVQGAPLRLRAVTAEDLTVLAAALQDALGMLADVAWLTKRRRFALVVNRFRWEAQRRTGGERVRTGITIEHVTGVRGLGLDPKAGERIISLLDLTFEPAADGAGTVRLVLAGGSVIALDVEALEITLTDLSQPWETDSIPQHDD